jgi:hypothetical protein
MNEKIRALAEQCEVWHSYDDCDSCEVDVEKFAVLILQRAMEVVRDEVAYHSDWDCADDVIKTVNEYFEVE